MNPKDITIKILDSLKEKITIENLRDTYFSDNPTFFSRKRKIDPSGLISFILKKSMKSYDLRLNDLMENFGLKNEELPTKQAISKARSKLNWKIFYDIFKLSSEIYLKNNGSTKSWNNYQVYAIDGSDCEVPTTSETLSYFGNIASQKSYNSAGATTSTLTDVLNGVILDAVIDSYKTSERSMGLQHCENVKELIDLKHSIFVCDRGYPSYDFLGYFHDNNMKYVMRIKEGLTKMRTPGIEDGEVYLKLRGRMRTVRTIEIILDNGTKEYLVTNLTKEEMPKELFKELYFLRWPIEGKYQELKNHLMLEEFSGKTVNNVIQDYYACLFLSNISTLIKNAVDSEIQKEEGKHYKKYQANKSFITGCMNNLIEMFLRRKIDICEKLDQLIERAKMKRSLIRPNRKNERNKNLNRRKHYINYKPCI